MQFPENPIMHMNESVCSEHIYMTAISPVGVGAPLQSAEVMRCLLVLVCYGAGAVHVMERKTGICEPLMVHERTAKKDVCVCILKGSYDAILSFPFSLECYKLFLRR